MAASINNQIITLLESKGSAKQNAYKFTTQAFQFIKSELDTLSSSLFNKYKLSNDALEIYSKSKSDFETEITVCEDKIIYLMHTNVFALEQTHPFWKTTYIKKDNSNAFCGMISVYNFLTDSFKYNKITDVGHLVARIFINKDGHFFMETLSDVKTPYAKFSSEAISQKNINNIVETLTLYCLKFDLEIPPFAQNEQISVAEIVDTTTNQGLPTGKRLGFKFNSTENQ